MEAQRGVALVVLSKIQGKLMIDFLPFLGPDGQLHIGFPPSDAIERNLVADLVPHQHIPVIHPAAPHLIQFPYRSLVQPSVSDMQLPWETHLPVP